MTFEKTEREKIREKIEDQRFWAQERANFLFLIGRAWDDHVPDIARYFRKRDAEAKEALEKFDIKK